MTLRRALLRLSLLLLVHVSAAHAAPQNGWWWNPAENGRGFFIEIVDGLAYIGAYVYAPDGRADWVVSQGTMTNANSYSGRLLTFRGGQSLDGDYRAPGPAIDVGAINIQFTSDRTATLTWPGGTVSIERLVFDATPAQPIPRTGWWWNENESGVGYSVEVQGSTLFVVGFMYDDAGNAVWYYAAGPMASPTSFTAPMYAFANGQAIGAPYRAPTAPVRVGTLTLEFFAPDEAELTLADSAAVTVKRRPRRGPQTPVLPTPRISLPPNWNGSFTWELEIHRTEAGGFTVHEVTTVVLNGDFFDPLPSPPTPARTRTYDFVGTMDVTYRHQGLIPSLGSCSHSFSGSEAVPSSVTLLVRDDGSYELKAAVSMDLTARGICAVLGRSSPSTKEFPVHFNKARRGNVVSSRIFGHPRDEPSGAGTERMNWHFLATL